MSDPHNILKTGDPLDQLLRSYLLFENENHSSKQQAMNISMEIVFNSASTYNPSALKEQELIDKLYKNFERRFPRGFMWGGLVLLLMGIGLFFYLSQNGQKASIIQSGTVSASSKTDLAGIKKPGSKSDSLQLLKINATGENEPENNNDTGIKPTNNDSERGIKKLPLIVKKGKDSTQKTLKFDMGNDFTMGKPDWRDFGTNWTESPQKFEKQKGHFVADTIGGVYWTVDKYKFDHDYYEGTPLKKTPHDLIYINYGGQLQEEQKNNERKKAKPNRYETPTVRLPLACRFYLDTQFTKIVYYTYHLPEIPEAILTQVLHPFYFRKYEVTNLEYRQFLLWVANQNGFANFPEAHKNALNIARAFAYTFFNPGIRALEGLPSKIINVYPDTLAFIKDFPFTETKDDSNGMVGKYFNNKSYDDYPVCGVNYWQVMAYLDWKTKGYQDYLDQNHIPYQATFALPSDIEWEMAASIGDNPPRNGIPYYNPLFDNNWICSLDLSIAHGTERYRPLDNMLNNDVEYLDNYIIDGYWLPGPAEITPKVLKYLKNTPGTIHLTPSGISWLDGNVSEWMQETYMQNWIAMYKKHQSFLEKQDGEDYKILEMVENYFNKRNATDGHLVRGGNFYDERFSDIYKKNFAGIMPKRFVAPSQSNSTIGFRYVLRIEKK
jgi:formylglycine-generating enzyme required for sulfatase activity